MVRRDFLIARDMTHMCESIGVQTQDRKLFSRWLSCKT
jgi:hypothetical protein